MMKSRRELISGLLIDVAKAIFIAVVLGKTTNPELVNWFVMSTGIVATIVFAYFAVKIHPESNVDKEIF